MFRYVHAIHWQVGRPEGVQVEAFYKPLGKQVRHILTTATASLFHSQALPGLDCVLSFQDDVRQDQTLRWSFYLI